MLRVIFGFVGLLVVLAIVSSIAKNQLHAIGQIGSSSRVMTPGAEAPAAGDSATTREVTKAVGGARLDAFGATAGAEMPSAQQNIRGIQESVRTRTQDALQQGADRNARSQP